MASEVIQSNILLVATPDFKIFPVTWFSWNRSFLLTTFQSALSSLFFSWHQTVYSNSWKVQHLRSASHYLQESHKIWILHCFSEKNCPINHSCSQLLCKKHKIDFTKVSKIMKQDFFVFLKNWATLSRIFWGNCAWKRKMSSERHLLNVPADLCCKVTTMQFDSSQSAFWVDGHQFGFIGDQSERMNPGGWTVFSVQWTVSKHESIKKNENEWRFGQKKSRHSIWFCAKYTMRCQQLTAKSSHLFGFRLIGWMERFW